MDFEKSCGGNIRKTFEVVPTLFKISKHFPKLCENIKHTSFLVILYLSEYKFYLGASVGRPNFNIGMDYKSDQIFLVLFRHLNYVIHLYDPHFYVGFFNPSIPTIREMVEHDGTVGKYYNLVLTEVR